MLNKLDALISVIYKVLTVVLSIIFSAMFIICILHVWFRFVINDSLTWSEEFMKIGLVWFCSLSITVLAARREHVSIVIFVEKMPQKVRRILACATQAMVFVVCLVMVYVGIDMVLGAGSRMTPALKFPQALWYAAIPTAFSILSLYEFRNLIAELTNGKREAIDKPNDDIFADLSIDLGEVDDSKI